jgi:hypothetical protein
MTLPTVEGVGHLRQHFSVPIRGLRDPVSMLWETYLRDPTSLLSINSSHLNFILRLPGASRTTVVGTIALIDSLLVDLYSLSFVALL